jgi:hypothetical protein
VHRLWPCHSQPGSSAARSDGRVTTGPARTIDVLEDIQSDSEPPSRTQVATHSGSTWRVYQEVHCLLAQEIEKQRPAATAVHHAARGQSADAGLDPRAAHPRIRNSVLGIDPRPTAPASGIRVQGKTTCVVRLAPRCFARQHRWRARDFLGALILASLLSYNARQTAPE